MPSGADDIGIAFEATKQVPTVVVCGQRCVVNPVWRNPPKAVLAAGRPARPMSVIALPKRPGMRRYGHHPWGESCPAANRECRRQFRTERGCTKGLGLSTTASRQAISAATNNETRIQ